MVGVENMAGFGGGIMKNKNNGNNNKKVKEDMTVKEFVDWAISQNPIVYKRLSEI